MTVLNTLLEATASLINTNQDVISVTLDEVKGGYISLASLVGGKAAEIAYKRWASPAVGWLTGVFVALSLGVVKMAFGRRPGVVKELLEALDDPEPVWDSHTGELLAGGVVFKYGASTIILVGNEDVCRILRPKDIATVRYKIGNVVRRIEDRDMTRKEREAAEKVRKAREGVL